jgi:polysaccharide pyruvyl transferase WcaK-like protein
MRWLVVGHYGGKNTGDEAMLAGLVNRSRRCLGDDFVVATRKGVLPVAVSSSDADAVAAKIIPVVKALWAADGIILGGGSHFQDDFRGLRYARHFRYMLRFVVLGALAKRLGKKVVWLSMGFGPFNRAPTRWITRWGLSTTDAVSVREAASSREVGGWLPPDKLRLSFDLAALLPLVTGELTDEPQKVRGRLGVSVTSVKRALAGGAGLDGAFWDRFNNALAETMESHPQVQVEVFVIRGGHREDDARLSRMVHRRLSQVDTSRARLVDFDDDPMATLRRIAACETFIATRFHAGVFAYLGACSLMLVAYHRKIEDLAFEIGLDPSAVIDVYTETSGEVLAKKINDLVARPELYRSKLPVEEAVRRAQINIDILREMSSEP